MSDPNTNTQPALLAATGAAQRAADALMRAAGGRSVLLRVPAPAVPDDAGEQLGLATPQFQDVPLGPAVFRKARPSGTAGDPPLWELLVSASAVARAASPQGYGGAASFFQSAAGVVIDTQFFELIAATETQAFGQTYMYRLVLRTRAADVV